MSKRKARLLCLHGYRQSGPEFMSKLDKLGVKTLAEFVCPTAPHFIPGDDVIGLASGYGWMIVPPKTETAFDWFNIEKYDGLDDSLEFLKKTVQEQGPFDGVVGFSQGGVVASLLAHMSTPTADSSSNAIEVWPFKFAIFFASFPASATECKQIYSNGPCSLPSLHFWGSKDTLVPNTLSQNLADKFVTPEIWVHDSSHVVPNKGPDKTTLRKFLEAHK